MNNPLEVPTQAQVRMAEIREMVKNCHDRETAEYYYRNFIQLAHDLSREHFPKPERRKIIARL